MLSLKAHAGRIAGLAFSRDGKMLYSAGADRLIRIWDGSPEDAGAKPAEPNDNNSPDSE